MFLLCCVLKLNTTRTLKILGKDINSTKLYYKRTPKQIVTRSVGTLLAFASSESTTKTF